ncbi:hypothetical protein OUZ56_026037 [Daphnia magna]|uniref:Uncharacterized protein n=1 Tax=Daphnia magna TaxID=35525 RepID=A0ABQ9ZKQ3_9CRUS|nr:hypothetical protein OUZ56_026037 [Daphnia magna]
MTCFKKPPLAITAADLPMSIGVQPTAVTNPSQSTASASAAVPPRRTPPRQPRPPHTTQEGEAFLPLPPPVLSCSSVAFPCYSHSESESDCCGAQQLRRGGDVKNRDL